MTASRSYYSLWQCWIILKPQFIRMNPCAINNSLALYLHLLLSNGIKDNSSCDLSILILNEVYEVHIIGSIGSFLSFVILLYRGGKQGQ